MAGSDDDWAGNSVPWNPELPVFEPSHNLLLDAGPWTVPYADFTPPPSPFALEMRSETIEQLVGGDALRRGESERIEAGRSEENSDAVAGRDRVRVQGTLHEHTGHGLAEQVAHLDTTVDGRLDVHTGNEDMVLLAGHMKDVWDGGTAIVAAMTDDLVAGGGVRVTAPLDLWVHGLMGVEERIGTCTADAVLMELAATHYEREYGLGVHAVGLAVYNGSLYLSNRSSFRPLMRVSSGVRNLIAGGGSGGAGDGAGDGAGSAPAASPPPVPAAGGAETQAVSETFSAATGSARSVEAVVEAGARSDDLTGLHRISDGADGTRAEELERAHLEMMARIDEALAGVGNAGFVPSADDLSALTRSPDSAEQLAGLQRGEIPSASLESIHPPARNGADDVHRAGALNDAHPPVPGLGQPHTESSEASNWNLMFASLTLDLLTHQSSGDQLAAQAHQAAIDAIADTVFTAFRRTGGNVDELNPTRFNFTQVLVIRRTLEDMAADARRSGDLGRADEIAQTLQEIDRYTYQTVARLRDPGSALDAHGPFGTPNARVGPTMDEPEIAGYETVGAGGSEPFDLGYEVVRDGPYRIASDSGSVSSLDGDSSLHSESGYNPPPMPAKTVERVADSYGRVILRRDAYEKIQNGVVSLRVVDARGHEVAQGAYTLVVEGYDVAETNVLYSRVTHAARGAENADVRNLPASFPAILNDSAPPIPPRTPEALEILNPASLSPSAPADPGASPLAGLAEVDETQVGLTGRGGSPDTNRRERRVRFGTVTVIEYDPPPGWQAGEMPSFGGAEALRKHGYEDSFRERVVQTLMGRPDLSLSVDDVDILRRRYREATVSGEVERGTPLAYSMATFVYGVDTRYSRGDLSVAAGGSHQIDWDALDALLQLFDAPRPGRVGRDRPI